MAEFRIKVNPKQNLAYIPRKLVESLGNTLKIVLSSEAAIIYSDRTPLEDVVASVEIILQDLKLRITIDQRAAGK